jgi:hypothetical protein
MKMSQLSKLLCRTYYCFMLSQDSEADEADERSFRLLSTPSRYLPVSFLIRTFLLPLISSLNVLSNITRGN